MKRVRWCLLATLALAATIAALTGPAVAAPEGQMTYAVHVSLAPTWFDPAETPGSSRRSWCSTRSTTPS